MSAGSDVHPLCDIRPYGSDVVEETEKFGYFADHVPRADVKGRALVHVLRLDVEDALAAVRGRAPGLFDDV